MIISFSVSNFRSFSSEETFSLVAINRLSGSHENHAVSIPGCNEKALKVAVIYGANGAGKSNLFRALRYLKELALKTRKKGSGTGREPFRFNKNFNEPSSFDLQFSVNDSLYRFGLNVNDNHITEEWLIKIVGKKEKVLYERITSDDGEVSIDTPKLKNYGKKLSALITVGGPQNQSFLSTINATLESSDVSDELNNILNWFDDGLNLIAPDEPIAPLGHLLNSDSDFKKFANDFLNASSTGVDHLDVTKNEIEEEELRNILPSNVVSMVLDKSPEENGPAHIIGLNDGNEITIERTDKKHIFHVNVQAAHENNDGGFTALDLKEESDGTQRLLQLIPALHDLKNNNAVYFIDEIDRSMHPMLIWKFIEFFLKSCLDGQRQLIVTTHESNLLDLDLLRRDEIWFVEKDDNASHLYSLSDYKIRTDLGIRKHYLQGRFGAIPFLGNLDCLLNEE